MCSPACLEFGRSALLETEIRGKNVLEVGALDVNGSLRSFIESHRPASYTGVDIAPGPGVDLLCDVTALIDRFGRESADLVICTEGLEHFLPWRMAVSHLKGVLATGGVLLVTTRSEGFPLHGFPYDFWRFSVGDIQAIFSDLIIERCEADSDQPGVFFKARRPASFREVSLAAHELYSIVRLRRIRDLEASDLNVFHAIRQMYPDIFHLMDVWVRGGCGELRPYPESALCPLCSAARAGEEIRALKDECNLLRRQLRDIERSRVWRSAQAVRGLFGRRW